MQLNIPPRDPALVARLVEDLDARGYAVLKGVVSETDLGPARRFVQSAVARSGRQYVVFTGLEAMDGSSIEQLAQAEAFGDLFRQVYARGTGRRPPEIRFHAVLRCLTGRTAREHCLRFHFDSYLLTGLLPIEMPKEGKAGDFVLLPNIRPVRSSYLFSLVDKILLSNRLSRALMRLLVRARLVRPTRVRLEPGDLYLFWGYRSAHTNEPCDEDKLRATALFHYADPHADSRLQAGIARMRAGAAA